MIKEENYIKMMNETVMPYLNARKTEVFLEREAGNKIYCAHYTSDVPKGVVFISHGFTETAEKYREHIYYFLKEGYHVYCIEHCGHGRSYRLTEDASLVHIDRYERFIEDLLFAAEFAKHENSEFPMFLYAHSMGGGIGAAAVSKRPELFAKVVLSSPMIRPLTGRVPVPIAKGIAYIACKSGKGERYAAGQKPYDGSEIFEKSASTSRARFDYYQKIRKETSMFQMNGASYGWLSSALRLNHYLRFKGWKRMNMPVLVFEAEQENYVSKREIERFVRKISRKGDVRLIYVPGSKHEIFSGDDRIVDRYWKKTLGFFREKQIRIKY